MRIAVPELSVSPYRLFLCVGFALAAGVGLTLLFLRGFSLAIGIALLLSSVLAFLLAAAAMRIWTGRERIVYYHHEIAVLALGSLLLRILNAPLLPYLDALILGVGCVISSLRVGCLLAGCCHGRPCNSGVSYSRKHVSMGFPSYYAGVPLFPVQLLESVLAILVTGVGIFIVQAGRYPDGTAVVWYTIGYGVARFYLEFLRGDPERPFLAGFSEAQWTSLALTGAVGVLAAMGLLPGGVGAAVGFGLFALQMLAIAGYRRFSGSRGHIYMNPHHVREIAAILDESTGAPETGATDFALAETSRGFRLSGGWANHRPFYSFSSRAGTLTARTSRSIAKLIVSLRHPEAGSYRLLSSDAGIYHLVLDLSTAQASPVRVLRDDSQSLAFAKAAGASAAESRSHLPPGT